MKTKIDCPPPSVQIKPHGREVHGGDDRMQRFMTFKKPVLDSLVLGYENEYPSIVYSVGFFSDLLNKLLGPDPTNPQYGGLRIYFAAFLNNDQDPIGNALIPAGMENHLCLIFVPTGASQQDDISRCWIVDPNNPDQVMEINAKTAKSPQTDTISNWIKYYQFGKHPALTKDGQCRQRISSFVETRSIWYATAMLKSRPDKKGLYDYFTCLKNSGKLDKIEVYFAAHLVNEMDDQQTPLNYHLTLIFDFHETGDDNINPFTFSYTDLTDQEKNDFPLDGGNTDTGLPCPPSDTCNGSQLPAS